MTGGEVRHRDGGIIGEATVDVVRQFHMDFAVIGVSGITEDGTLLDFDYREVKVAQAIMQNSEQVLLCADNSKFGRSAMVRLGSMNQISHLFTNESPSSPFVEAINLAGVKLHTPKG